MRTCNVSAMLQQTGVFVERPQIGRDAAPGRAIPCCSLVMFQQPEMRNHNATSSLRAQSGMVFAGRSEAIPYMAEIVSSQTTLLAMMPA